MTSLVRAVAACSLLSSAVCAWPGETESANPTGDCRARADGSREGDHSADGSKWLPDCKNTLAREYYRVFARSETSAYTIPRLDGAAGLQPACADADHKVAWLVEKYSLCESASSAAAVERVNGMLPTDALTLTHFLHERMKFVIGAEERGISPAPFRTDVVDACALGENDSAELEAICERERERLQAGTDEGIEYEGSGAVELVARLNELYGIED
jgi:hypothetical protein